MDQIHINQHRYTYKIHRQSPNLPYLLMLHGFMGDHRAFEHLIPKLNSFCNPVTVDLLGFGGSSQSSQPEDYKEHRQVKELLELINTLQLSPLYLYGYSMGGRLALQAAVTDSAPFQGLILESTTCGITSGDQRLERQQKDDKRAQRITSDFNKFLTRWKELPLFNAPLPIDRERFDRYDKMQGEQNPQALAASLRGFGTGKMRTVCSKLSRVTLPALVMAGSADQKYMKICPALAERMPNGRFRSVTAGHRIHLDNPPALVGHIKEFINQLFLLN